MLALVVNPQFAPAPPTSGQALQQSRALADGTGGLLGAWANVASQASLIHFESGPVNETRMMIFDQHPPLGPRQMMGPLL
jgi:hypothetical protein